MTTKLRFALILLAVFGAAFALTGLIVVLLDDGGGTGAAPASAGQIRWTIEDARAFEEFALYWLGESYDGLPLTHIVRARYEYKVHPEEAKILGQDLLKEDVVFFAYGTCDPGSDGGCPPPLVVNIEPYCVNPQLNVEKSFTPGAPFQLRDVSAQEEAGHLLLETDVRVTIYTAADDIALATQAAEALRLVEDDGKSTTGPLPPPADSSC